MRAFVPVIMMMGCLNEPIGLAPVFPPAGAVLSLRRGAVADLDGDGKSDLILLNTAAGNFGIYILMGSKRTPGGSYDSFISTGSVMPLAVAAGKIGAAIDLIVVGVDGSDGVMLAFDGKGGGRFAAPQKKSLLFKPKMSMFVAIAAPNVVIGDEDNLASVNLSKWPEVSSATFVELHPRVDCPGPNQGAFFVEESKDLLVQLFGCVSRFTSEGESFSTMGKTITWSQTEHGHFGGDALEIETLDFADFDGDGNLDVVGGHSWVMGLTARSLLDATSMQIPAPVLEPAREPTTVSSVAAGNFDGVGGTDVLFLEPVSGLRVNIFDNVDQTLTRVGDGLDYPFSESTPKFLAHGDFRGRGMDDLLAVGDDQIVCLQLEGGILKPCH